MKAWKDGDPEPTEGSVVLMHGETGTAAQRFFRDGLWRVPGRSEPLTWDEVVARCGADRVLVLSEPPSDGVPGQFTVLGTWKRGLGAPVVLGVLDGPHEIRLLDANVATWTRVVRAVDEATAITEALLTVDAERHTVVCGSCDWAISGKQETVDRMQRRHAERNPEHDVYRRSVTR